jgi:hypothetical protein
MAAAQIFIYLLFLGPEKYLRMYLKNKTNSDRFCGSVFYILCKIR